MLDRALTSSRPLELRDQLHAQFEAEETCESRTIEDRSSCLNSHNAQLLDAAQDDTETESCAESSSTQSQLSDIRHSQSPPATETPTPLLEESQHKKNLLLSFRFKGQQLSEDELATVIHVTAGWESAQTEFEHRKEKFQVWREQPTTFWDLPFEHNASTGLDLVADCCKAIDFGKDDKHPHRLRFWMEIMQMVVIQVVGEKTDGLGEALRVVAQRIARYHPGKTFDQVVKKVSTYRKKGEKLLSLGLGLHLVLSTNKFERKALSVKEHSAVLSYASAVLTWDTRQFLREVWIAIVEGLIGNEIPTSVLLLRDEDVHQKAAACKRKYSAFQIDYALTDLDSSLELNPRTHMRHSRSQLPIQPPQAVPYSLLPPISQTTMAMPADPLSWRGGQSREPDTTNRVVDLAELPPDSYPSLWQDDGYGGSSVANPVVDPAHLPMDLGPNMWAFDENGASNTTGQLVDLAQLPPDQDATGWYQDLRGSNSNIDMTQVSPFPVAWSLSAGSNSIFSKLATVRSSGNR
ncbi:hypothetical protein LTR51_008671 [Lithohypha guttulata]|nr:hypothetical protein LTR51_008671 [Lithohypha guttulata]